MVSLAIVITRLVLISNVDVRAPVIVCTTCSTAKLVGLSRNACSHLGGWRSLWCCFADSTDWEMRECCLSDAKGIHYDSVRRWRTGPCPALPWQ